MKENQNSRKDILMIIGMIALIAALVIGVKLVFAGLGAAIGDPDVSMSAQSTQVDAPPQDAQADGQEQNVDGDTTGPRFCTHCGKEMREGFRWGQFCPYCGEKVE